MIYVIIAAVAAGVAGYYFGARSQKKHLEGHRDILEQIIFSLRCCGDNLLINNNSRTTLQQFKKLRDIADKVVSTPNKKTR